MCKIGDQQIVGQHYIYIYIHTHTHTHRITEGVTHNPRE